MRAVIQRASEASVTIGGQVRGSIGLGFVVLLGIEDADTAADIEWLCGKIARLRVFNDDDGLMNNSLADVGGGVLVISQFTLAAIWRKGNRPGFSAAAEPEMAEKHYQYFCRQLAAEGVPVRTGKFRSPMAVSLVNDGPVTIWMDSKDK